MMKLKVSAIGNATGVIFPPELMEKLHISQGDTLYVLETQKGFELSPHNPKFVKQMAIAEEVMREDRDVLSKLAQ